MKSHINTSSDHMPWGYQALADKCANGGDLCSLDNF